MAMRIVWVGLHAEGLPALEALLAAGAPIAAILTLRPDLRERRSGGADYAPLAMRHGIPLHPITNINDPEALAILRELAPDLGCVIGWHQIVRPDALRLARLGMIGAHASLLPHNRGSAPINWAIIRGERQAGNTLFWLAEDVDSGDIIDQTAFPITPYDTCASLYAQVAESNRAMLLALWPRLQAGERPSRRQAATPEPVLPRRRPADGGIEWQADGRSIYDFVRALTRPYPGAFSCLDGRRWRIWHAAYPAGLDAIMAPPGEVLGPVVSPVDTACGQLVACGRGAVIVLEVEGDDGTRLNGRALSDQAWTGKRWTGA